MIDHRCIIPTFICLSALSCGPAQTGAPDPSSASNSGGSDAPNSASDHCDVLPNKLKDVKLTCLPIPGFIVAGIYGTREYPNETTLEAGFGGQIPSGIIGAARPGGTMSKTFSKKDSVKASAGVSLSKFYNWLPDVEISADADDYIDVEITLGELSSVPVQNLPEEIRPIVDSSKADARTKAVRNMLTKLCKSDTVVSSMTLAAKPLITITTGSHSTLKAKVGWENIAGFTADATKQQSGSIKLTSNVPIVFAAQLRESEPWVRELCQLAPCGGEGQVCCGDDPCGAGLACSDKKCSVPPPPPKPCDMACSAHALVLTSPRTYVITQKEFYGGGRLESSLLRSGGLLDHLPSANSWRVTGNQTEAIKMCSKDRKGDTGGCSWSCAKDPDGVTFTIGGDGNGIGAGKAALKVWCE